MILFDVLEKFYIQEHCYPNLIPTFHSAAAYNHGRIVELLLENGADPEAKEMLSMTPFLIAVTLGASQSVKVLLDHGAAMTATDSSLNSCLHLAVNYRRAEIVKMLLERDKYKVSELKDKDLKTVFHLAARLEDSKVFSCFLLCNSLVNGHN